MHTLPPHPLTYPINPTLSKQLTMSHSRRNLSTQYLINTTYNQYNILSTTIPYQHNILSTHTLSTHPGKSQLRRTRRLVVSFMTTIANYDYGFAYHLYPDGTIESAIKLTGALSTGVYSYEEQVTHEHTNA